MRECGSEAFKQGSEATTKHSLFPCLKKPKAALLTELHCVAALKGLQEDRAFVHVFVRVRMCVREIILKHNPKSCTFPRRKLPSARGAPGM